MAKFSITLLDEIEDALENITFGSVEIYVQDKKVTQITVRNIKKTSVALTSQSADEEDFVDVTKVFPPSTVENKSGRKFRY